MGGWHGAICVASRSTIISGQYIWRAKEKEKLWRQGDTTAINETWGRLMARRGYNTYMSGKWHAQAPAEKVFDEVRHERPGMNPYRKLQCIIQLMADLLSDEGIGNLSCGRVRGMEFSENTGGFKGFAKDATV